MKKKIKTDGIISPTSDCQTAHTTNNFAIENVLTMKRKKVIITITSDDLRIEVER
jgi:hypothetical protein